MSRTALVGDRVISRGSTKHSRAGRIVRLDKVDGHAKWCVEWDDGSAQELVCPQSMKRLKRSEEDAASLASSTTAPPAAAAAAPPVHSSSAPLPADGGDGSVPMRDERKQIDPDVGASHPPPPASLG